jgi:hypothetical protein
MIGAGTGGETESNQARPARRGCFDLDLVDKLGGEISGPSNWTEGQLCRVGRGGVITIGTCCSLCFTSIDSNGAGRKVACSEREEGKEAIAASSVTASSLIVHEGYA